MLPQFLNHIDKHDLCNKTDRILLAVSGGVDSMVMLHLFEQLGYAIGVAHCNFQLRGDESEADARMVQEKCDKLNIPFYSIRFNTSEYATLNKISIQLAARNLRYQFFEELVAHHQYNYIATAHHLNDSLETVLLNLIRGTGLDGLTGIPVKNGKIIRPLLFATREMVKDYAISNGIVWREDLSNQSDDYSRNLIRNQVVPILRNINPNFDQVFQSTLTRLQGAKVLVQQTIEEIKRNFFIQKGDSVLIKKDGIVQYNDPETLLWEIIKLYGFYFDQCRVIVKSHQSGKYFYSNTHQLIVDRDDFIIVPRKEEHFIMQKIFYGETLCRSGNHALSMHEVDDKSFKMSKDPLIAQIDADKIHYPLIWRKWKPGDAFWPIGMKGKKKVSDFLIDKKVAVSDKTQVTVLESAGEIVWIVGLRISENVKITQSTNRIIVIRHEVESIAKS